MESVDTARKRRVLIGALIMCIERSRVRNVVAIDTIRSILESASGELWREGEFRLEMVWKILCQQPGMSPKDVAPPLLVFKAHEEALGVKVRMPEALAAIPLREQDRLRKSIDVRAVDFAATLDALRKLAAEAPVESLAEAARAAGVGGPLKAASSGRRTQLAVALSVVAVLALGGSLYFSFRDTRHDFDFSDVANVLEIKNGRRVENALVGELTDPRWEKLGADDRQKLVATVFQRAATQGVHALTLIDPHGQVRATAFNAGRLQVLIR
jgi:hypothetical protein